MFSKRIELIEKFNSKELAFWIIDRINFIEKILILLMFRQGCKHSPNSYDAFKKVFRADKFKFDDKPLKIN
jgi:hypothetical protein